MAGIGSDHHLMVAKIKLKLAAAFKLLLTRSRTFDRNKLKDKDSNRSLSNNSLARSQN
jgi:hypothetical protein